MSDIIKVLLVDDHEMVRQGTAALLRRVPGFEIVGEASDGERAIELAKSRQPDVVVMDVHMPGLSGIEATRRIRESLSGIQVLVLSAYDDDYYVVSLLRAGARGSLLKTAPIQELVQAIQQVYTGEFPFHPAILRKVVLNFPSRRAAAPEPPGELVEPDDLTEREQLVLKLLAEGMSNREIAQALVISDRTVQAHLTRLFAKMGVNSRLDAVLTAIRRGWLTIRP